MTASSAEFADRVLNDWLAGIGMGVEYTRAEGTTIYYRDSDGAEVPVLDHACGFGSLIFGHNPPEIIEHAKSVLDARIPVHAQLSVQPHANEIGARLNAIIQRETGTDTRYSAVFGNSGAEAIEICMKHAELERQHRLSTLRTEIEEHVAEARAAVAAGLAAVATDEDIDALCDRIVRDNADTFAAPPVYLTLDGAFHGKLVGSIQLTHNEQWRIPFAALAPPARFLPVDTGSLPDAVRDVRRRVLDLVVDDGVVRVVSRECPVVGAFFVEPIRGGAGMKPVSPELAREIERVAEELDCPIVVDEVQSGLGRAGALLASSHMGLRADYYTFAKSIGGGLVKNSLALIRQDRFQPEFEVIHSSTFAKDGLSGAIALRVLDMLEADDGQAYRQATERGDKLGALLESVHADFPDVIANVWGLGLMRAIELHDQSESTSEFIREKAQHHVLGYCLAGYLLRAHRIRVLPAGPGWRFIRFQPALHITDAELARTETAVRGLCQLLRDRNGTELAATINAA